VKFMNILRGAQAIKFGNLCCIARATDSVVTEIPYTSVFMLYLQRNIDID
jgi:hypothetical protein